VRLPRREGDSAEFGVLQMRPLVLSRELEDVVLADVPARRRFVKATACWAMVEHVDCMMLSSSTSIASIGDVARRWPRPSRTLITRWWNADPISFNWSGAVGIERSVVGIPVTWDQIAGAKAIVEAGFRDFRVTPSQGSHFFQNLTSFQIGYFTVNPDAGEGFIDWNGLRLCRQKENGTVSVISTSRIHLKW